MSERYAVVTFPYNNKKPTVWRKLNELIRFLNSGLLIKNPLLVINRYTQLKREDQDQTSWNVYQEFTQHDEKQNGSVEYDPLEAWSVDTCQMWLTGMGKVRDRAEAAENMDAQSVLIHVAGDLGSIGNLGRFQEELEEMCERVERQGDVFVAGDYDVTPGTAKELIDLYGSCQLLAVWFPGIARRIPEDLPRFGQRTIGVCDGRVRNTLRFHSLFSTRRFVVANSRTNKRSLSLCTP